MVGKNLIQINAFRGDAGKKGCWPLQDRRGGPGGPEGRINMHSNRKTGVLKIKSLSVVIALSIAMPLGIVDTAFAAKKTEHVTYEQAWARCKVFADALARDAQSQRYSRGAACMHMYGYRM